MSQVYYSDLLPLAPIIALPLGTSGNLLGTCTYLTNFKGNYLFATCLHVILKINTLNILFLEHSGDCSKSQIYPVYSSKQLAASVIATDPFADLAIVAAISPLPRGGISPKSAKIACGAGSCPVGAEILVFGYPFAVPPLNSALEIRTPGYVTALARRRLNPSSASEVVVDELAVSVVAHPGLSGGAVVGRYDGILHGIVRGSLAPPSLIGFGGRHDVFSDTSITLATSAHLLHDLLRVARQAVEAGL